MIEFRPAPPDISTAGDPEEADLDLEDANLVDLNAINSKKEEPKIPEKEQKVIVEDLKNEIQQAITETIQERKNTTNHKNEEKLSAESTRSRPMFGAKESARVTPVVQDTTPGPRPLFGIKKPSKESEEKVEKQTPLKKVEKNKEPNVVQKTVQYFKNKIYKVAGFIKNKALDTADFFIKSYGDHILDFYVDIPRLQFTDKNNGYTRGILPKWVRIPGLWGVGNAVSMGLEKVLGRRISSIINNTRKRINKVLGAPFNAIGRVISRTSSHVSRVLPFKEARQKAVDKVRSADNHLEKIVQKTNQLINGGVRGIIERRRERKKQKMATQSLEVKKEVIETPKKKTFGTPLFTEQKATKTGPHGRPLFQKEKKKVA